MKIELKAEISVKLNQKQLEALIAAIQEIQDERQQEDFEERGQSKIPIKFKRKENADCKHK